MGLKELEHFGLEHITGEGSLNLLQMFQIKIIKLISMIGPGFLKGNWMSILQSSTMKFLLIFVELDEFNLFSEIYLHLMINHI